MRKNAEREFMSSKRTERAPEGQARKSIMDQHEEVEAVEPNDSAEQVDPRDEKIANLEVRLAEAQIRERDANVLRIKAEMENLRHCAERDIEKRINSLSRSSSAIAAGSRWRRIARWKSRAKANPDIAAMVRRIELTRSMLDVVRKVRRGK